MGKHLWFISFVQLVVSTGLNAQRRIWCRLATKVMAVPQLGCVKNVGNYPNVVGFTVRMGPDFAHQTPHLIRNRSLGDSNVSLFLLILGLQIAGPHFLIFLTGKLQHQHFLVCRPCSIY